MDLTDQQLAMFAEHAKRDDAHKFFLPSDLRQLVGMAQRAKAAYPKEMSEELKSILGTPCFAIAGECEIFRAGGHEIARKAEAEQAFFIHWALNLYFEHGDNWRQVGGKELEAIVMGIPGSPKKEA
jgi:hypothetical protein